MSNIVMVGMGKLGWPVAVAMKKCGHEVRGYDIDPRTVEAVNACTPWTQEDGFEEACKEYNVPCQLISGEDSENHIAQIKSWADIVFVAVQTPHDPRYEGITPLPIERKDFEYGYLDQALEWVAQVTLPPFRKLPIAVISTVLPGNIEGLFKKHSIEYGVYTPAFIAMGTVIQDYLKPEFFLLGVDNVDASYVLREFYKTINEYAPVLTMPIRDAELTKVAYNTAISTKLGMVGAIAELAHKSGCNANTVMTALTVATNRITSGKYMIPGMGDGGACHPRDNIAMSYLSQKLGCHFDWFNMIMKAREHQAMWFAREVTEQCDAHQLKPFMVGTAFKPETNITTGSHALLTKRFIDLFVDTCESADPLIDGELEAKQRVLEAGPRVFFVGCAHQCVREFQFPPQSVVIDPNGIIEDQEGVHVVRLAR